VNDKEIVVRLTALEKRIAKMEKRKTEISPFFATDRGNPTFKDPELIRTLREGRMDQSDNPATTAGPVFA
jgi:hypothetical protein